MAAPDPMRVLCVLSPSNQMYSGIGRAIIELAKRLAGRVRFEFAMSDYLTRNLDILRRFCDEHGLPLHVGRGRAEAGSLDTFNDSLPDLLRRGRWDLVECVCWANAATNEGVLAGIGGTPLCYTPHDQPTWTVPMSAEQAAHIESVHRRVLHRADLVCCDSPRERELLQEFGPGRNNCRFLPLGCDFEQFRAGPLRRRDQLLFVGDLAEPRKRFDRVLAVFARLLETRPTLRLIVVGNRSDEVRGLIPAPLRHACELRGYVSEEELRRAYAESAGLILMSDFEAFGIPILEALASGTPVFLHQQETTRGLFGTFRGAHFCPGDDAEVSASIVAEVLSRSKDGVAEVIAERGRVRATFDWDVVAERKWVAMRAAWTGRRGWARSA